MSRGRSSRRRSAPTEYAGMRQGVCQQAARSQRPLVAYRVLLRIANARRMAGEAQIHMDLTIWLPAMFLLGLVAMIGCYAFIGACEKI